MSRGPRHLFRHSSPETLRALFEAVGASDVAFQQDMSPKIRADLAEEALAALPAEQREGLQAVIMSIDALAKTSAEDCLREASGASRPEVMARFAQMRSSHDRVAWIWLNHRDIFDRGRAIWFFERRSTSARFADAFSAPATCAVASDLSQVEARIADILAADLGETLRVKVERFDYSDGAVLLSIWHQELWKSDTEFGESGDIQPRVHRPVQHAAAKIESGVVTVAAERGGATRRQALCNAIAEHGMGLSVELARLPPLTYDLQRLLDLAPFETNPVDEITAVMVTALTVSAPILEDALQHTFTSGRNRSDVRERVIASIKPMDLRFAKVLAAELCVVFAPNAERRRQRNLRLIFSGSTTRRVQLDCAEETLLRSRYFGAWGLIAPRRDVGAHVR